MAFIAERKRRRRAANKIVENVASLDEFAVWYGDSALEIRDSWAATVRVARARRELGLAFGEDFDCLHEARRGRHVPVTYKTVSWSRIPGHILSYPPGEPLPEDLVEKVGEIDDLISVPAGEMDDLLWSFGLEPAEMAHNRTDDCWWAGSPLPPPPTSLLAPHVLKQQAAVARLVIGAGHGEAARADVWKRVDQLVARECNPEVWFNQGLVNYRAYYSLWTDQDGDPIPTDQRHLVTSYEVLEEVMRSDTDRWRAAEADISGHRVLPDP